jgi:hypothetical protein
MILPFAGNRAASYHRGETVTDMAFNVSVPGLEFLIFQKHCATFRFLWAINGAAGDREKQSRQP